MERLDKETILAFCLRKDRVFLYAHSEYHLTPFEFIKYLFLKSRRMNGAPIAYLTGKKEFFGLDFFVNKNVLIPRPDTELMVEEVLNTISNIQQPIFLIDIGTGSGCIPIAITKNSPDKIHKIIAIDKSKKALHVAKKNAAYHKVDIELRQGDLLAPIKSEIKNLKSAIVITANLPYLTYDQFKAENTIKKEPKLALVADNKNGLSLYEKLLRQIASISIIQYPHLWGATRRVAISIFLEIDPKQKTAAEKLIKEILPNSNIKIKTDLAGRDRLVAIEIV